MTTTAATTSGRVALRPLLEGEVLVSDDSPWDDWGLRNAPPLTDLDRLAVELDGTAVGNVSWHPVFYGPNLASRAYNIGIGLGEAFRGQGIGSQAQRLLAEHLFATTDVVRVEASTDVGNLAERRALEKAGFTLEGILRSAQGRADGVHDLASYSLLRVDLERCPGDTPI